MERRAKIATTDTYDESMQNRYRETKKKEGSHYYFELQNAQSHMTWVMYLIKRCWGNSSAVAPFFNSARDDAEISCTYALYTEERIYIINCSGSRFLTKACIYDRMTSRTIASSTNITWDQCQQLELAHHWEWQFFLWGITAWVISFYIIDKNNTSQNNHALIFFLSSLKQKKKRRSHEQ